MPTREERFLAKIEKQPGGCWLWTATVTLPPKGRRAGGYGLFWNGEKLVLAHRWAYEHWRGPIPAGRPLDHEVCDTPACANPWHVEASTPRENNARSASVTAGNSAKTHCPEGHPYNGSNTYVDCTGRRHCRACQRRRQKENGTAYMREYRRRKKDGIAMREYRRRKKEGN